MVFSIAIYASPAHQASHSAYQFAQALLSQGHRLYRVFFYHDGVYLTSALNCPPQDETHYTEQWQQLAQQHDIDMVVCIAAGLRRGIIDSKEAERYEKAAHNLGASFELAGLGQLIDASVHSDRLMTFGH